MTKENKTLWIKSFMECSKTTSFTLIELLIACVIVAILGAIGGVYFVQIVEKAHVSEANTVLGVLRKAQIVYRDEWGNVSPSYEGLGVSFTDLKYFENINVTASSWEGYLANISRRDNFRYGGYTLSINRNGNITCSQDGTKPCPPLD